MKKIEEYLNKVFLNVNPNDEEAAELKEEIRGHLLESVNDLIAEGKSEELAVELAIRRYGAVRESEGLVKQLVRTQKVFAKKVLIIALAALIFSFGLFAVLEYHNNRLFEQESIVAQQVSSILGQSDQLTSAIKKQIQEKVTENADHILSVRVYKYIGGPHKDSEEAVQSESNSMDFLQTDQPVFTYKTPQANGKSIESFDTYFSDVYDFGSSSNNNKWFVMYKTLHPNSEYRAVFLLGICIYWTLFAVFATINAYHRERFSKLWIVVFALFNVVGYLFYLAINRTARA